MEVGDCKGSSLMASDVREYNSVLLAALLHDIGKMLHRTPGWYGTSHEKVSGRFIAETREKLENPELYDLPLVKFLIQSHHGLKKEVMARVEAQALGLNEHRLWKLISIVKRADSYSCAERDQKQELRPISEMRKASLDSIFSRLKLGVENGAKGPPSRYHLTQLSPIDAFPEDIDLLEDKEIEGLIEQFNENIPDFTGFKDFGSVLNVWVDILQRYTWAVPSNTRYQTSDVSLFDHLRSTAAIAACLYKRHITAVEEGRNLDRINEFVLIGGDFSGIQRYIFEITNLGSGGASKRLRARSFFISMFSEMSSHKILHALGLPLLCNLFSAGGKFLLLAPNLERSDDAEGVEETLIRVKREIEEEIHTQFFGQFSFLMSWFPIRGFKAEFQVGASKAGPKSFFETADRMFHQLERERSRKLQTALIDKDSLKWLPEAFKATDVYNMYDGAGDCKYCGKGPGNNEDPLREGVVKCCKSCYDQKNIIGAELPKAGFVAFGRSPLPPEDSDNRTIVFHAKSGLREEPQGIKKPEAYYFDLLDKPIDNHDYYVIYDVQNGGEASFQNHGYPLIKKFLANHVPTGKKGKVLSFEQISRGYSDDEKEGSDEDKGDLLGVLKADIDNLGLLFNKGFDIPIREEEGLKTPIQRKSASRFLTMSRMIELFFAGWIKQVMSEIKKDRAISLLLNGNAVERQKFEKYLGGDQIDFKCIYTVYSGGDDLVLVGLWETMIVFAMLLNSQFRRFTGNNPSTTLSAGLAFIKPNLPIATAIRQADQLLTRSKENGKNRLTLFDTTVEWKDLPELVNFFLFLDEKTADERFRNNGPSRNEKAAEGQSRIRMSFLYRLLTYQKIARSYIHDKRVTGLRCLPLLSYDIGRNILRHSDKGKDLGRRHEEYMELTRLLNAGPLEKSIWRGLQVPISWCIYKKRGDSQNESE